MFGFSLIRTKDLETLRKHARELADSLEFQKENKRLRVILSDRDSEIQALKDGIKMQLSMLRAMYRVKADD